MDVAKEPPMPPKYPPMFRQAAYVATAVALFAWRASPILALVLGFTYALLLGNPWSAMTRSLSQRALAASVVGLGAGMNLLVVGKLGLHGLWLTMGSIGLALILGKLLGGYLGVSKDTAVLISVGTAICGGSAIAAIAPTIRAKDEDISVALAAVFLLNAVALVVFPSLGHLLQLNQDSFGTWAALAIHDTSSVIGAGAQYGPRALEVATATKLARALWIVPVTLAVAFGRARHRVGTDPAKTKPTFPWFIAGFLLVAALVTYVPALRGVGHWVALFAQRLLIVTLFLIGLGLSRKVIRSVGIRPLMLGALLWLCLGLATLTSVKLQASPKALRAQVAHSPMRCELQGLALTSAQPCFSRVE